MNAKVRLAVDRYDRHFPFFDGTLTLPPDVGLEVLQIGQTVVLRDGEFRHERMMAGEFDAAEFSLSSYLMARDRGIALTAIPVFPRRLFSMGLFHLPLQSPIAAPGDLVGRRVGLNAFQTTLSVLARGDLARDYGVPWEEIIWCVSNPEKVGFTPKPGLRIEALPDGSDLGLALASGRIDAFIHPHPPHSVTSGAVRTRPLWRDRREEELAYFRRNGYMPIMHVVAMRPESVAARPELPRLLMRLFEEAKAISRSYYEDPNWSQLAWARQGFEEQQALLGDAWVNGIAANARNLERFIDYAVDQQLIGRRLSLSELFEPATLDS